MTVGYNITEVGSQIARGKRESLCKVDLVQLTRSKTGMIILMSVKDGLTAKGT